MIQVFFKDLFQIYNIEMTAMNKVALRIIVNIMVKNGYANIEHQRINLNKEIFEYLLNVHIKSFEHFDIFYNLKSDLNAYFEYVIKSYVDSQKISFEAFFCPGYTKHGYKDRLGHTTVWKLEELSKIRESLIKMDLSPQINCYYCDSFIENYDDSKCPNWQEELEFNKELFRLEAAKYFDSQNILNTSDLPIFHSAESIKGYIDEELIARLSPKLYRAFKLSNDKFYKSLNFTEEQIKFRNDKLVTMYLMISDYINKCVENGIYLPMENMYDREKIIATNKTCTFYLKQRRN